MGNRERALADFRPGAHLALVVRSLDLELLDRGERVLAQLASIGDFRSVNHLVEQRDHLLAL